MNRLANETSPYLLQHAHNPVDWYPWGEEALAKARAENKPILLSVGYSACHWCHVMAHESFEDPATAEIMNRLYINIKVDREERPDVDDIYMQAVQALSGGRGGWPMTVFLLPDGRPFYGGTYFPREPRYGLPSFRQILEGVHDAYTRRRDEVERAAGSLTDALDRTVLRMGDPDALADDLLDLAAERLLREFDPVHGGFSGAPKFPQPMSLEFLLRAHQRSGSADALRAVQLTLEKMARGGMYDQIGGGFHRYSVDAFWLVPHFEKMLYDNAQLSRVYLHAWQVTGRVDFRRIAEEIYDYILREMTAPEGGFYSATDADSEGHEGRFFVWQKDELESLLGEDAELAIAYWGISETGNFDGANILHVAHPEAEIAHRFQLTTNKLREKIEALRDKLYAARTRRIAPALDDKILSAWNGMMLASLSEAARALKNPKYLDAAVRAGTFLRERMITPEGRLYRTHKGGVSHLNGYLEDYGCLIDGFLELYQSTFDESWFITARTLADSALRHFRAEDGGFFDTSDDHETLITRPRSLQDNATPAGSSILAKGLLRLAALTGEGTYYDAARAALSLIVHAMREYPQAFGEALSAAALLIEGIDEVAIIGSLQDPITNRLLDVVRLKYRPNTVLAHAPRDTDSNHAIPLLRDRRTITGMPTAYICRNLACQMPVVTPEEVFELLNRTR
jgi:uncharacterized protein YyaL (SSP411 family)